MQDLELFAQWCAGDRTAGNRLFQRYLPSVYYFFANKVEGDTDELVQATFLACVRSQQRMNIKSSFRAYLFSIARHELYAYLRKRKRDQDHLDFGSTSIIDMGISPTARLARGQRHQELLLALRSLPIEQQMLLELYYWEEMKIPELSEFLDIAETATRARLTRARKALRKQLEQIKAKDGGVGYDNPDDLDAWARSVRAKQVS